MVCHAHGSGKRAKSSGTDGAHSGQEPLETVEDPEETETLPGKGASVPQYGRYVSGIYLRGDRSSEKTAGRAGKVQRVPCIAGKPGSRKIFRGSYSCGGEGSGVPEKCLRI